MIYVNTIAINQYDLSTLLNCLRIYFYKEEPALLEVGIGMIRLYL